MSKPLIGITARIVLNASNLPAVQILRAYADAVLAAGGTPVLIPPQLPEPDWHGLLARLDGVLFSGGGDIGIEHFNGEPHATIEVDVVRDTIELPLLRAVAEEGKPFLGICRGLQVVNVALGGTLYTHISDQHPNALDHDMRDDVIRTHLAHPVRIEEGTRLAEILGEPLVQVNSLHHQGIKDLAPGLKASAYAPDGLIEAVELPEHPFGLAVQWHPEWLMDQESTRNLFRSFVEAAGQ
ncbi:MAG TPA: gamma-glutamyl-gamma-aminobutyrate hydrolase family protein [Anaerolineales bacterium]|jgi:putative glutamine amidotransferase